MKFESTAKTPRRQERRTMNSLQARTIKNVRLKFEMANKKISSVFCRSWRLGVLAVNICLLPSVLLACPRCVDATPYKTGMQMAVAILLPIPAVLVTALFFWIRNASKEETEQP
jgi:hypothetical protein